MFILKPFYRKKYTFNKKKRKPTLQRRGTQPPKSRPSRPGQGAEREVAPVTLLVTCKATLRTLPYTWEMAGNGAYAGKSLEGSE